MSKESKKEKSMITMKRNYRGYVTKRKARLKKAVFKKTQTSLKRFPE